MHLASYLGLLRDSEASLAKGFQLVRAHHGDEPDVERLCEVLGDQTAAHVRALDPIVQRYGEQGDPEPDRLQGAEFSGTREGGIGLLRDLQDLYSLASFVDITWTVIGQAAQALRDRQLLQVVTTCQADTTRQLTWLQTRIKQAAPQALIASD